MHRLLPIALLFVLTACESPQELLPPVVQATPLEVDPETVGPLASWWLGTDHLLRLEEDEGYRIYAGPNPHRRVTERGRWSQPTYAHVVLEPYTRFERGRTRLTLDRVADGSPVLVDADGVVLLGLESAPQAPEDQLIGRWSGTVGHLDLLTGARYDFTSVLASGDRGYMPGHTGEWSLVGDRVLLQPFAGNLGPYGFDIARDDDDSIAALDSTVGHLIHDERR